MPAPVLPAGQTPAQKGCTLGWASFAVPADPAMVTTAYDGTIGFDGRPRADTRMLCTNPLTGIPDTAAGPDANIGTLKRSEEHTSELQSLMRISYAVFCLKKKKNKIKYNT